MNKRDAGFIAVILAGVTFVVYYFTIPLAPKVSSPDSRSIVENIVPQEEAGPMQKTIDFPIEPPSNWIPSDFQVPPTSGIEQSHVISYSKSKMTIRYYARPELHNMKLLTIKANGVPTEAIFDTGASYIVFNRETINKLGIRSFSRTQISQTASGPTISYMFRMPSIKLGTIELRNVECAYVPASEDNLLGGSFLANFVYSINEADQTITFIPRGEKILYTDTGIEVAPGEGWAEINGIKYVYRDGRFETQ
jgi:clan AA aspartic protease (TIGR02281 family)